MSTLSITTLEDRASLASTPVLNAINGSSKAWVNFNGTGTVAIRASYNVSSITDNGTGDYTVNFTTAMPDANYAAAGIANLVSGLIGVITENQINSTKTTLAYRVAGLNTVSNTYADLNTMMVSIFR